MLLIPKNTKEGVPHEIRISLRSFLRYAEKVTDLLSLFKTLFDPRKRRSIPAFNILLSVLAFFVLRHGSLHEVFSAPKPLRGEMMKGLMKLVKGRIPLRDAATSFISSLALRAHVVNGKKYLGLKDILDEVVKRLKKSRILKKSAVDGLVSVAIDGTEIRSGPKEKGANCLDRHHGNGSTDYYQAAVMVTLIGGKCHFVLGEKMREPREGKEKSVGELTAGVNLLKELYETHHHFADVIAADALYCNATFVNTVLDIGMDCVVQLKDENRDVYKDAKGFFDAGKGRIGEFEEDDVQVDVSEMRNVEMKDVNRQKVRVLRFTETRPYSKTRKEPETVWVITTMCSAKPRTIWRIIHLRWEIENNTFHVLKTQCHLSHCFCSAGLEQFLVFLLIAFNLREAYLYSHRGAVLRENPAITGKIITNLLRNSLREDCLHDITGSRLIDENAERLRSRIRCLNIQPAA